MTSKDPSVYTRGLPITMSDAGLETLMKAWLAQTGTPSEVLKQYFIDGEGDLGERVIRTVLATALASMVAENEVESNDVEGENTDCKNGR